jgi:hypothetical protein
MQKVEGSSPFIRFKEPCGTAIEATVPCTVRVSF